MDENELDFDEGFQRGYKEGLEDMKEEIIELMNRMINCITNDEKLITNFIEDDEK